MRTFLTLTIILLFAVVPVMAQSATDEAAVREATQQYLAALKAHDSNALAALHTDDCVNWLGDTNQKERWLQAAKEGWGERWENAQYEILEEIGMVFITPDVAIHKFTWQGTGILDEDGKTVPPRKNLRAFVYVKEDGKWLRAAQFGRPIEE
jgi:uncharacterized protein (TIGR02246 family)